MQRISSISFFVLEMFWNIENNLFVSTVVIVFYEVHQTVSDVNHSIDVIVKWVELKATLVAETVT